MNATSADKTKAAERVKAFYTPSDGRTSWACGYWSRDGQFYRTGPWRDDMHAAQQDALRKMQS